MGSPAKSSVRIGRILDGMFAAEGKRSGVGGIEVNAGGVGAGNRSGEQLALVLKRRVLPDTETEAGCDDPETIDSYILPLERVVEQNCLQPLQQHGHKHKGNGPNKILVATAPARHIGQFVEAGRKNQRREEKRDEVAQTMPASVES